MSGRICSPKKVRYGPQGYPVPETPTATCSVPGSVLALGPREDQGRPSRAKLRLIREIRRGHSESLTGSAMQAETLAALLTVVSQHPAQ